MGESGVDCAFIMIALSRKTELLLEKSFPDGETRELAAKVLVDECGDNLPFCEDSSPEDMERIRFSALKVSAGDLNKLGEAAKLANLNWRDLFVAAGFGQDVEAYSKWYAETIEG